MSTQHTYALQTLPPAATPSSPSSHQPHPTPSRTAIIPYSTLFPSPTPHFHPGLLSRPRPSASAIILHKLNVLYTAVGLAFTSALTFITYRLNVHSWQLAQWTAQKDFLELCLELKQAELSLSNDCTRALAEGLEPSPDFLSRRWLSDLSDRIGDWASGVQYLDAGRSEWSGIRYPKDGKVWYGGPDAPRDELIAEAPTLDMGMTVTHDDLRFGFSWVLVGLPSIALVLWAAWPIVKYLAFYLHRKCVKFIWRPRETGVTVLQGSYQLSTINETRFTDPDRDLYFTWTTGASIHDKSVAQRHDRKGTR